jgi:hypothetical protein
MSSQISNAATWAVPTNGWNTLRWWVVTWGSLFVMDTQWSSADSRAGPLAVREGVSMGSEICETGLFGGRESSKTQEKMGLCSFARGVHLNVRDVLITSKYQARLSARTKYGCEVCYCEEKDNEDNNIINNK